MFVFIQIFIKSIIRFLNASQPHGWSFVIMTFTLTGLAGGAFETFARASVGVGSIVTPASIHARATCAFVDVCYQNCTILFVFCSFIGQELNIVINKGMVLCSIIALSLELVTSDQNKTMYID